MRTDAAEERSGSPAPPFPRWVLGVSALAFVAGAVAWAVEVSSPGRGTAAWVGLLVNTLFWMGIAQAGVVWAAIFRLCGVRWSAAAMRMGQMCVAFLPLALVAAIGLFVGRVHILPWIASGVGDRGAYLNVPFVYLRNGGLLLALTALSLWFTYRELPARHSGPASPIGPLTVALLIVYAVAFSFLAFDFIMGLAPFWYSTLLGAYFFCSNLYLGMAALILLLIAVRRRLGWQAYLGRKEWTDLGSLLQAFGMITVYMFFSQLLPIWYENMPHETNFLILRYHSEPWRTMTIILIATGYLGAFVMLLTREVKQNPRSLGLVSAIVLASMGMERYLLVAPSLMPKHPTFGVLDALVVLGFAGAFLLSVGWFANRHLASFDLQADRTEAPAEPQPAEGALVEGGGS